MRQERKVRRCIHHWLVETTEGRLAQGVCRLCGAKREFTNDFEYYRPRISRGDPMGRTNEALIEKMAIERKNGETV